MIFLEPKKSFQKVSPHSVFPKSQRFFSRLRWPNNGWPALWRLRRSWWLRGPMGGRRAGPGTHGPHTPKLRRSGQRTGRRVCHVGHSGHSGHGGHRGHRGHGGHGGHAAAHAIAHAIAHAPLWGTTSSSLPWHLSGRVLAEFQRNVKENSSGYVGQYWRPWDNKCWASLVAHPPSGCAILTQSNLETKLL